MAADVHFQIRGDRGREILDELQEHTGESPYLESATERRYNLTADHADTSGFDATLDRIAPDWREHLNRATDRD